MTLTRVDAGLQANADAKPVLTRDRETGSRRRDKPSPRIEHVGNVLHVGHVSNVPVHRRSKPAPGLETSVEGPGYL